MVEIQSITFSGILVINLRLFESVCARPPTPSLYGLVYHYVLVSPALIGRCCGTGSNRLTSGLRRTRMSAGTQCELKLRDYSATSDLNAENAPSALLWH